MIAEHFRPLQPAGDPAAAWADALVEAAGGRGVVALLSAPGYMEDHQVIAFLGAKLRERGCRTQLAGPRQIVWREGLAHLESPWFRGRVDVLVRFYQSEWLARSKPGCDWKPYFRGGKTPMANSGFAAITESKRFPLVWESLSTPLDTWRSLLPETRLPCDAPWEHDDGWLLKTAMCNNGDTVCIRDLLGRHEWFRARWSARWFPRQWVAQRRFESSTISTPGGPRHLCVGIYTVNGRVAGAYARLAEKAVIDFAAVDAALLLRNDE
jgi:hypothetical protein